MSLRDTLNRALSRAEVDHIDSGTAHLTAMREREAEREALQRSLRAQADARPDGLMAAVRRRAKFFT